MPIISLSNVTKAFGTQVLVEGATVSVDASDRIGVVGANGTGKTTLLRLMAGLEEPTAGAVHVARGTRLGFLAQEPDFGGHGSVLDAALSAFTRVHELDVRIAALREQLADGTGETERLLAEQGELEHEFERLGGYTIRQRAEAALHGIGFHGDAIHAPVEQLSGGERSRLAIAHLLLGQPDVLLLDEPTNHLDIDGLEWLEAFLTRFAGAAVVVSHDRRFLDVFATRMLDLDDTQAELYRGNYAAYLVQKAERMARRRKLYDAQHQRLAKEADFIQRYIAGQRGREAKGRRKRLARVERRERPADRKQVAVRIPPAVRSGHVVVSVQGLAKAFDGRVLFDGLDLEVTRGERIGIVGPNGAGKTTLLRLLIGEEEPTAGQTRLGHNVQPGYYRQDRNDLDPKQTILDAVWEKAPTARAGELRNLLGLFLFVGDDVFKKVGNLSGGEQARVALARLILAAPNLLLLDEPTNHLDIPSRLALEDALNAFEGTVLLVSHDRYVLERCADKILEVRDGRARLYQCPYWRYAERARDEGVGAAAPPADRPKGTARPRRGASRRKPRPIEVVERLILEREEAVGTLVNAMSDPELYRSPETARTLSAQLEAVRTELARLYDEWDEAADAAT